MSSVASAEEDGAHPGVSFPLDIGIEIIDCHAHIGQFGPFHNGDGSAEAMIASADLLGVSRMAVSACLAISGDVRLGNRLVYEAVERFGDRFLGYVTVNPHYPEETLVLIEEGFGRGAVGVKLHPSTHGMPIDCEGYLPAWEETARRGAILLTHTWGLDGDASVEKTARMAEKFPDAHVIFGHTGGLDHKEIDKAIAIIRQTPNAYADTCASAHPWGMVEKCVEAGLGRRLLYGSDVPFLDAAPSLGRVVYAEISDEEKRDILGRNMLRVLGEL
jgi:hypothetical protein